MKHQIPELVTNGFYKEALNLYTHRHSISLLPDKFTFPSLFKACAKLKSPIEGQIIHAHLIKSEFSSDVYTATALSGMYMKLNLLSDALKVFDEMPDRNLVSLTSAISGLAHNGYFRQALRVFKESVVGTFRPDSVTVASALSACESVDHGLQMHCLAIKLGVEMDVYVATSLMNMYWNQKEIILATRVFDEMPDRNLVTLTSAISGFANNGYFRQALRLFKEALVGTFRPNSVTVASALSACESVDHGLQMHCLAIKLGVEMNVYVATSLMAMYSNQKEIILATRVFGEMPEKNVVSYSALFTGLLNNGFPLVVLKVFKIMSECSSEAPNSVTFVSVISACADLLYLQFGRQVHGLIQKIEMQSDTMIGTALVDMYSKCGCLPWALNVFQELNGRRNIQTWNLMISGMMLNGQSSKAMDFFDQLAYEGFKPDSQTWNSMISGFSQQGMGFEAFKCFQNMQLAGTVPNSKCITSVLSACANYSSLKCGKETHGHVIRIELNKDEFMATTLIYMYMKCGQPAWARRVFDQFEIKPDDPVFWNVMMSGYRMNGEYETAVEVFDLMQKEKEVRMSTPARKIDEGF